MLATADKPPNTNSPEDYRIKSALSRFKIVHQYVERLAIATQDEFTVVDDEFKYGRNSYQIFNLERDILEPYLAGKPIIMWAHTRLGERLLQVCGQPQWFRSRYYERSKQWLKQVGMQRSDIVDYADRKAKQSEITGASYEVEPKIIDSHASLSILGFALWYLAVQEAPNDNEISLCHLVGLAFITKLLAVKKEASGRAG